MLGLLGDVKICTTKFQILQPWRGKHSVDPVQQVKMKYDLSDLAVEELAIAIIILNQAAVLNAMINAKLPFSPQRVTSTSKYKN